MHRDWPRVRVEWHAIWRGHIATVAVILRDGRRHGAKGDQSIDERTHAEYIVLGRHNASLLLPRCSSMAYWRSSPLWFIGQVLSPAHAIGMNAPCWSRPCRQGPLLVPPLKYATPQIVELYRAAIRHCLADADQKPRTAQPDRAIGDDRLALERSDSRNDAGCTLCRRIDPDGARDATDGKLITASHVE